MATDLAQALRDAHLDCSGAQLDDPARPPAISFCRASLASLPEELLAHAACFLLSPPLSAVDLSLYGPFVGAYMDTECDDVDWDAQLDQPKRTTRAQVLPPLRNLGALRLVDRRLERAAVGLLFARVGVPTIERLEWLFARPRLAACVKWLDILTHALYEKAALDDNLPDPGAVLQALVRLLPQLRSLSIQAPLPAALANSLRDPLTGRRLRIDLLERLSIVSQSCRFDDPELINNARAQIMRLTPLLPFIVQHPRLHTLHMSGCQLAPDQLGSFLGPLAGAGIRLRVLSIEVSSRLAVGFEDALVNRLRCLEACGREMGGSLHTVRLFGEHAAFGVDRLDAAVADLIPRLSTLSALSNLNLGFTSLDSSSPLLAKLVATQLLPVCPALTASAVWWEEEKVGVEEIHTSMVNFYSHRLGRSWVSAGGVAGGAAAAAS